VIVPSEAPRQLDRFHACEGIARPLAGLLAQLQSGHCTLGIASQGLQEARIWGQLVVVGQKALGLGQVFKGIQQHRLADPT
jgi:hypothetical protein